VYRIVDLYLCPLPLGAGMLFNVSMILEGNRLLEETPTKVTAVANHSGEN